MLPTALSMEWSGQHGQGTRGSKVGQVNTPINPTQMGGLVKVVSDCCDPMDCSPPGSSILGILQARILAWVAMPSSRGNPGIEPVSPALAGRFFTTEPLGKLLLLINGKLTSYVFGTVVQLMICCGHISELERKQRYILHPFK